MLAYAAVGEEPNTPSWDSNLPYTPPSRFQRRWRLRGVLAATLLASGAAAVWLKHGGLARLTVTGVGEQVEVKENPHISFSVSNYGARGCPSGTIVVPSLERCKDYAGRAHFQGLCAKHEGYGPDCDGPEDERADWCASRPLGCWQSKNGCTYYKASGTDEPQMDVRPVCQVVEHGPLSLNSLFCLAVLTTAYERGMLQMQHEQTLGVFACDNHSIFSEESVELVPGSFTTALHVSTDCKTSPQGTCMNAELFVEVWKQVLLDSRFRRYAWTVKLDVDAVFLPHRALASLHGEWDPPRGIYVVNCRRGNQYSLKGAVEVFSRNAVEIYRKGWHMCVKGSGRLHFDSWDEALYMDECMKKLGVYRREDDKLLLTPHCGLPEDEPGALTSGGTSAWKSCNRPGYIAFHPFSEEQNYLHCISNTGQTTA